MIKRTALAALLVIGMGCASNAVVVDRLFFGTNIPGGGVVSDDEWKSFVKDVVTPKFKDGLTVLEGDGQWLDPRGDLVREHVHIVEVAHKRDAATDDAIRAIADEYKKRFKQDAVLRVTEPVTLRLY
ncbi:MAG TPA: DUF3574 domain-containing protein [Thermoanaerobaculia bacterium]|nr:DUF3574 domain-containing protein [Thermoanaerobaculia bacterium]